MTSYRYPDDPPDVHIRNEGNLVLFNPLTDAAREWWEECVDPDATRWGDAYVVEHRYAQDILWGLANAGFRVSAG